MCAASKRRVCSFDMAEVPPEGYVLAEEQGVWQRFTTKWAIWAASGHYTKRKKVRYGEK
jgi:hypothetical protein